MSKYIGIDIGDKVNAICVLNKNGDIIEECQVENSQSTMKEYLSQFKKARVAIEACSHSLWLNEIIVELGLRSFIANPRKTGIISFSQKKNDKNDAMLLARLVRSDPALLYPVVARDISTQQDLLLLKTRTMLVQARGDLVRHIRGIVKPFGMKLPKEVTTDNFHVKVKEILDEELLSRLTITLDAICDLAKKIKLLDKEIKELAKEKYPEADLLQSIPGVGIVSSLTFLLIIGDPKRFKKSRDIGAYFGLVPRQDQSGSIDKALPITKAGDSSMRSLLVNCSHHILGVYGKDNQIRRHGLKIMGNQDNRIRKKKAVIAVARKLAILMHRMLISGEPFKNKVA